MGTWARTGPVVVEVDGSAEGLHVVDYAVLEAIRANAELVLAAPYQAHSSYTPMMPGYLPKSPGALADDSLRVAVAHVRHHYGYNIAMTAVSAEGSRHKVLSQVARHARLLVVARARTRGPHRLVAAQRNIFLAGRIGCPVLVVPLTWRPSAADRKVAVGIDGTPVSLEAVEFAFRAAADREADLTVMHAERAPRHEREVDGPEDSWVRRGDLTVDEALTGWQDQYPEVRVSRILTARPVVEALVHEGAYAGLVVLGARAGRLPIGDPIARQAVAAMACPVAIVPHRPITVEEQLPRATRRTTDIVVPT